MTMPLDGVARLMYFVDARLQQLGISKEESARRGFPNPTTLAKVRDRDSQHTPRVRTLLRIDRALGWQPGSSAVVLLGGNPLSLTARVTKGVRAREAAARPVTADEITGRLLDQLNGEIDGLRGDMAGLDARLQRLHAVHRRLADEFRLDARLLEEYAAE
ncbi:hypothetical protein [Mycobacterium sp. GA-2829]|uniref:hypothetical protein n=1 Tax=Mycobacterium sp. GA-2829 TaxID=1772283 RepID=UPI0007402F69|nr:hypothetical protein [Mycobacterium sp. GA-2829]KUI36193.1 hypothetical protein AU194_15865 [Mycobacterium sp. GA-2829]